MNYNRPIVLSIAGFDPTGGAGVLADVKTFEQFHVLGMGVLSATTVQTESSFMKVNWLSVPEIIQQLEPLVMNYTIEVVKIGIIESLKTMDTLVSWLLEKIPNCKIVWDPVLAASSGFELHSEIETSLLHGILRRIYLLTPNVPEARKLTDLLDEIESGFQLGEYTNVLLKGGHSALRVGVDLLIENKRPVEIDVQTAQKKTEKHGSGCMLSSAIAAGLAQGLTLELACEKGKEYTEKRLSSNHQLLAYHVE